MTVFDGIAAGRTSFDSTVTAAGGTVVSDTWAGLSGGTSIDRGDYTITRNGGGSFWVSSYGSMSGQTVDISPARNDGGWWDASGRTDPMDYYNAGVTLTFSSAINSIGFEVGDWATCCYDPVTELFISFDDGAPIKVASATTWSQGLFPSQTNPASSVYEIFVAAFDDSGEFTKVSFWGNGLGEYLVFGGQVRYALLDEGSLPPIGDVPLPASSLLLLGGLGGIAALRRKRTK
ncbi:VPLPA-CTERM sorting domain-containing protein [Rhodovulum strictum]|uniref:VPLPA-CTERM sorting domain-containing protein n=1 Tax=Rhodovulum strictum TaxID=58314 RepID=UPI001B87CB51